MVSVSSFKTRFCLQDNFIYIYFINVFPINTMYAYTHILIYTKICDQQFNHLSIYTVTIY